MPQVVPIGRGMKDVDVVVWDAKAQRPCSPYELGEIIIRSRNVALGYMNAPELAYRFQGRLFGPEDDSPAYRSGDYGYSSLEHGVVFVGRTDSQAKINGHRVDLEQISSICRRCNLVGEAVTMIADLDGSPSLVTFLVPRDKLVVFDTSGFRSWLAEKLPCYMVPARIETISAIPLTRNNKIDMKALREMLTAPTAPEASPVSGDRVAAFIADFVRSRVGCERFDSNATLEELGVDSVSFIGLITKLQKCFSMRTAGFTLHNGLTITRLAEVLQSADRGEPKHVLMHSLEPDGQDFGAASRVTAASIHFAGRILSHFCSNSYLGLGEHPELRAKLVEFVRSHDSLASHGSMLVNGSMDCHKRLEMQLCDLYGCGAAILYSSCYLANVSTISGLVGPGDQIFADEECHRSLRDGCSLSGADVIIFAHNDPVSLEAWLQSVGSAKGRKLIVTEAIFSIEGDIAGLPSLAKLAKKYNALLMVDEACSLGQLGSHGRGLEEHFRLPGTIDVRTGSLSKAIPSMGGYATCSEEIAKQLRFRQGAMFSTAISPIQAYLAVQALQIVERDGEALAERLQSNATRWRRGLFTCGFNIGNSATAITCIRLDSQERAQTLFNYLVEEGIYTLPVTNRWAAHTFGIRTSVTAAHEPNDIESAIERLGRLRS